MKRVIKRLLCAALAALLVLGCALAEEFAAEPAPQPVQETQEKPAQEKPVQETVEVKGTTDGGASSETTEATSTDSESGEAGETSDQPAGEPGGEIGGEPGDDSDQASGETTGESDEPTGGETGGDVEQETDDETDDIPAGGAEVTIIAEAAGAATLRGRTCVVAPDGAASLKFTWSCASACAAWSITLTGPEGVVYSGTRSDMAYTQDLAGLAAGSYTFMVAGTTADGASARGKYTFTLSIGEDSGDDSGDDSGEGPDEDRSDGEGGRGGGGHGGGGRSGGSRSGGKSGGGGQAEAEQGFRVTPGTALTSTHTSGTKDMRLYGTVELTVEDVPMTGLVLGGETIDIAADGEAFTANIDGGTLVLTAADGAAWTLNGYALKRLAMSGIDAVTLNAGTWSQTLDTGFTPQGAVYSRLRAQGIVSSNYDYRVSADGVAVSVDGARYALGAENALIPMEGDGLAETMDTAAAGAD